MLRIFPGLIVAVILTVTVIGAIATTLPLSEYFSRPNTYLYLTNAVLFPMQRMLPGVFYDIPIARLVNGSLWTLPLEVAMYGMVAALGLVRLLKPQVVLLLCVLIFAKFMHIPNANKIVYHGTVPVYFAVKHVLSFATGMLFAFMHKSLPRSPLVALSILFLTLASFHTTYAATLILFTLPYLVFYLAYADIPWLRNFSKYGDFSYGIYIYAFPIQQLFVSLFHDRMPFITYLFVTYGVLLVLSALSWHLIEKHALKLKKRFIRAA